MRKNNDFILAKDFCDKIFDGTHDSPKPCDIGKHKLVTSKNIINSKIDDICSNDVDEEEIRENLKDFWTQLNEGREKKYFIDRVFKKLGYFPEEIYLFESCILECGDNPENSYVQYILGASKRKNKEIK